MIYNLLIYIGQDSEEETEEESSLRDESSIIENTPQNRSSSLRRRRTSSTPKQNIKRRKQLSNPTSTSTTGSSTLCQPSQSSKKVLDIGKPRRRILKYNPIDTLTMALEPVGVFEELVGAGVWEKFMEDGVVVIPNIIPYLQEPEIKDIWEEESKLYLHHEEIHGGGYVWSQLHSLIQQIIRQDPLVYLLHIAAIIGSKAALGMDLDSDSLEEFCWLISTPTPLKYHPPNDLHSRLGFGLNPWHTEFHPSLLDPFSSVLLHDEDQKSALKVVKGFHMKLDTWKTQTTNSDISRQLHLPKKMYSGIEEVKYGSFTSIKGKLGDLRLVKAGILQKEDMSESSRREVCLSYILMPSKEGKLGSIRRQNRDMLLGSHEQFPATQLIRGVWYIGDAIMGHLAWDHVAVRYELWKFLSLDNVEKKIYIEKIRRKLKAEVIDRWENGVKKLEPVIYGENSFWKLGRE